MAYDEFSEEDARIALDNINQEVSNLLDTFKQDQEMATANYGTEGSALGGHAGSTAASAFEASSVETFNELSGHNDEFIQACEEVVKANQETAAAAEATYGSED